MKKVLIAAAVVLAAGVIAFPFIGKGDTDTDSNIPAEEMAEVFDSDRETGTGAQTQGASEEISNEDIIDENDFGIYEISDEIFARIKGKSFKANCTVPREQLRYLTIPHYDLDGNVQLGELICNVAIADDFIDIFKNLYAAKYPIERMVLIDEYGADDRTSMRANNTSCFNFRVVAGSTKLSNHALGLAIDLNPLYNPYVKRQKDGSLYVSPKEGTKYANRKANFPYKIDKDDLAYKEFIKHGFTWGGAWNTMQDYQHFEKKINR